MSGLADRPLAYTHAETTVHFPVGMKTTRLCTAPVPLTLRNYCSEKKKEEKKHPLVLVSISRVFLSVDLEIPRFAGDSNRKVCQRRGRTVVTQRTTECACTQSGSTLNTITRQF